MTATVALLGLAGGAALVVAVAAAIGGTPVPSSQGRSVAEHVEALHLSVAAGDYVWVHVDRASPSVEAKSDGRCRYDRRRAAAHIRRDVVPLLLGSPRHRRPLYHK